jgi:hypothetical protein
MAADSRANQHALCSPSPWRWWEAQQLDIVRKQLSRGVQHHDRRCIVLTFVGLMHPCWLLSTLAVYALPLFVGFTVALAGYHAGARPIAPIVVGLITSNTTFIAG